MSNDTIFKSIAKKDRDIQSKLKVAFGDWSNFVAEGDSGPAAYSDYSNMLYGYKNSRVDGDIEATLDNLCQLADDSIANHTNDKTYGTNARVDWLGSASKDEKLELKKQRMATLLYGMLNDLGSVNSTFQQELSTQGLDTDAHNNFKSPAARKKLAEFYFKKLKQQDKDFRLQLIAYTKAALEKAIKEEESEDNRQIFNKTLGKLTEIESSIISGKVQHQLYNESSYIGHLIFAALESITHNAVGLPLQAIDPNLAAEYYANLDRYANAKNPNYNSSASTVNAAMSNVRSPAPRPTNNNSGGE